MKASYRWCLTWLLKVSQYQKWCLYTSYVINGSRPRWEFKKPNKSCCKVSDLLWRCQERDEARAALEAAAAAAPQANGKRSADEDQDASAAKKVRHRLSCMLMSKSHPPGGEHSSRLWLLSRRITHYLGISP